MMTDGEILDSIEAEIFDGAPVGQTLRKLLLLGGRLQSEALMGWAKRELDGYPADSEVPDKRTVGAPIYIDAIVGRTQVTGQQVSAAALPSPASEKMKDEVTFRQPITEIESMIDNLRRTAKETVVLTVGGWEYIAHLIDKNVDFQQTHAMYRKIHISSLEALVDDVRNRAAELMGQFRAASSGGGLPHGSNADRLVHKLSITGNGNSILIAGGDLTGSQASVDSRTNAPEVGWWAAWGKVATITSVATGVLAVALWAAGLAG